MTGTGTTVVSGPLTLGGASQKTHQRSLQIAATSTATWTDGKIAISTGGSIDNLGTFRAEHEGAQSLIGAASRPFHNTGAFIKVAPGGFTLGDTSVSAALNNDGTVTVEAGVLSLGNGGTSAGDFTLDPASVLLLTAWTFDLSSTAQLSGGVTLLAQGGVLNLLSDALNSYDLGATTVAGTTVNLLGSVVALGDLTISSGTLNLDNPEGTATALTLDESGGSLTGRSDLVVAGPAVWDGGYMSGTGVTICNGGIELGTTTQKTLQRRLENAAGQIATTGTASGTPAIRIEGGRSRSPFRDRQSGPPGPPPEERTTGRECVLLPGSRVVHEKQPLPGGPTRTRTSRSGEHLPGRPVPAPDGIGGGGDPGALQDDLKPTRYGRSCRLLPARVPSPGPRRSGAGGGVTSG
jgi:hypothetical protein